MSTSAGTTSYDYDAANQLIEVRGPNNAVTTFAYDNIGLRTQKALPNGVTTNYGYDPLNRLTDIDQQKGGTTVASYAYVLDAAGNRLSVTEAGGSSIQWSYDDAYRLTNETRKSGSSIVAQSSFTYDLAGNRLSQQSMVNGQSSTVQYSYNELDQLLTAGPVNYQYDGRGNLINTTNNGQSIQYGYDAQNRLIAASMPDGTDITNTYDAGGHRVQQSVDSQITNYLWDEASMYGDVVLETGSGNTTSYVLAGNELLSQTRNGATSYYLQDGQGSTRGLANPAGNVTDTYDYTAFGDIHNQTGSTINRYLYTGQQFDDSSGLYSLRARYYNPSIGRFLSQDTYAINFNNPIELNRYGYTANNPINLVDPTGHEGFVGYAGINVNTTRNAGALVLIGASVRRGFILALIYLPAGVLIGELLGLDELVKDYPRTIEDIKKLPALWERPKQKTEPEPEPEPKPQLTPIPPYPPLPTPTEEPPKKHIAFSRGEYLAEFLTQVQAKLAPQNVRVYLSEQWDMVGLSDVRASVSNRTFHIAFEQAVVRAEQIHFNLQGIPHPVQYAEQYGSGDLYANGTYVTAWELYHIYHNPIALAKTTFYPNGVVTP